MEKTGHTSKKSYDFNTSGVLEVCIKGNWYRTTSNEFRSFDGMRRITQPERQPGQGQIKEFLEGGPLKMIITEYNGPVYILHTNLEVIRMDTETIVTNPKMPTYKKIISK